MKEREIPMTTRTVTIELAWRVETSHEIEVPYDGDIYPHDGNDDPQSLRDWLRDCEEHTPEILLNFEVFDADGNEVEGGTVEDCYAWQITDEETGEVWQK